MGTRSEHVAGTSTPAAEPDVEEAADAVASDADDIFISAKSNRRDRLPVSLRQGRHGVKSARKARGRSNRTFQAPRKMYLVDDDDLGGLEDGHVEHAETTRIAQRLSFEDFFGTNDLSEPQESVVG